MHGEQERHGVVVYDGNCGFCSGSARIIERIAPGVEVVAGQEADLASLGLTIEHVNEAVQWVEVDGTVRSGHAAIAAMLHSAGRPWKLAGRLMQLHGISSLAAGAYRLVSENRRHLPGSSSACAPPRDKGVGPHA